jgi:uncharacterized protein
VKLDTFTFIYSTLDYMENQTERPLPHPSELSGPHWQGARDHRLMVQHCGACAAYVFPPSPVCTHCFSTDLAWEQSSGRGRIYSYTIIHRAPAPSFEVPYCAAIITLEEGWNMISNIVGSPMEVIMVGLPVRVAFMVIGDVTLPIFRIQSEHGPSID